MITFISIFAIMTCVCMILAYNYWQSGIILHDEARHYYKTANERFTEAEGIWQKIGPYRAGRKAEYSGNAKIIPFRRHLSIVAPEDDEPNAA